jgi:two-component system, NarL family, nitrate/nitrite response regulator NarL
LTRLGPCLRSSRVTAASSHSGTASGSGFVSCNTLQRFRLKHKPCVDSKHSQRDPRLRNCNNRALRRFAVEWIWLTGRNMGAQTYPRTQSDQWRPQKIKVLLVDDHPFVLEGIRSCLASREQIEVVGEANNGQTAVEMAVRLLPDVVVMDITMPIMNGLEATSHLRRLAPNAKVLILSMHQTREFASEVVAVGARGYLSKNTSPAELVKAIETIAGGETYYSANLAKAFLKDFIANDGKPKPFTAKTELTLREREVVTLIATGLCNKEAASQLNVSVRTIEKHRERIMHKLELHGAVELTRYAIAHQLVQVDVHNETPAAPLPAPAFSGLPSGSCQELEEVAAG